MSLSLSLRTSRAATANHVPDTAPDPITVRPVRAAFGPHVALVSVDDSGRLWVRFSTAMLMFAAGIALMLIPVAAMLWVGGGLVDSGQVSFSNNDNATHSSTNPAAPNELPLANQPGH